MAARTPVLSERPVLLRAASGPLPQLAKPGRQFSGETESGVRLPAAALDSLIMSTRAATPAPQDVQEVLPPIAMPTPLPLPQPMPQIELVPPRPVSATCAVCFEAGRRVCVSPDCRDAVCVACLTEHFNHRFQGHGLGVCVPLTCPSCRAIVPVEIWQRVLPPEKHVAMERAAANALTMQCGRCHQRRSAMPPWTAAAAEQAERELNSQFKAAESEQSHMWADFLEARAAYLHGRVTALQFYRAVQSLEVVLAGPAREALRQEQRDARRGAGEARRRWNEVARASADIRNVQDQIRAAKDAFRAAMVGADGDRHAAPVKEARAQLKQRSGEYSRIRDANPAFRESQEADRAVKLVVERVKAMEDDFSRDFLARVAATLCDVERRSTALVCFYTQEKVVVTLCCKAHHCFVCKAAAHRGNPCNEVAFNNTVKRCPQCSIQLVKGDGCMSVTCVCGHHFNWSAVKDP